MLLKEYNETVVLEVERSMDAYLEVVGPLASGSSIYQSLDTITDFDQIYLALGGMKEPEFIEFEKEGSHDRVDFFAVFRDKLNGNEFKIQFGYGFVPI
jgi:hypothetical protein